MHGQQNIYIKKKLDLCVVCTDLPKRKYFLSINETFGQRSVKVIKYSV